MRAITTILSAIVESMAPDGTVARIRFRTFLDMLLTLIVTALAVVLAVGYPVLGRWARRQGWID